MFPWSVGSSSLFQPIFCDTVMLCPRFTEPKFESDLLRLLNSVRRAETLADMHMKLSQMSWQETGKNLTLVEDLSKTDINGGSHKGNPHFMQENEPPKLLVGKSCNLKSLTKA